MQERCSCSLEGTWKDDGCWYNTIEGLRSINKSTIEMAVSLWRGYCTSSEWEDASAVELGDGAQSGKPFVLKRWGVFERAG